MLSLLRTRITTIEPAFFSLTVRGRARVRVRGSAYGFVHCQSSLRWVFGAFDETFQVSRSGGELSVVACGLGGLRKRSLRFLSPADLTTSRPPRVLGRVRWSPVRVPRLPRLSRFVSPSAETPACAPDRAEQP